jgi:hypothetical protein
VFLSNGVIAAPATLQTLAANIEAASAAAADGGVVVTADVFDTGSDCIARGTNNMQVRFASGLPHASICATGNVPLGPSRFIHVEQRGDVRRAPTDSAATPGRNRDAGRDQGHVSVRAGPADRAGFVRLRTLRALRRDGLGDC